jgi:hypothetical protein
MSYQLYADLFTEADQPEMAGLHCGDEPFARAATAWITGPDVRDSIANRETKVWVFRDDADTVIGFGSLGPCRWRWPPPDGGYTRLLIIPQLGIDARYRGQPPDPDWRFSNQIMSHLIFEAQEWAAEIRETQHAKRHVDLLVVQVHRDNHAARCLYEKFEFIATPNYERHAHIVMSHRLAGPDVPT